MLGCGSVRVDTLQAWFLGFCREAKAEVMGLGDPMMGPSDRRRMLVQAFGIPNREQWGSLWNRETKKTSKSTLVL